MKIYFAGSIGSGRGDTNLYSQLVRHLKQYGKVFTEHAGNKELTLLREHGKTDDYIYNRNMDWVLQSDVIVAEVTTPNLRVGHEIDRGVENRKDILCLHREQPGRNLSDIVARFPDVTNKQYRSLDEAKRIIDNFFQQFP